MLKASAQDHSQQLSVGWYVFALLQIAIGVVTHWSFGLLLIFSGLVTLLSTAGIRDRQG